MPKFSFVIADDASFIRKLISNIIQENDAYCIVGEAKDGVEAIEQAKSLQPDIMTLDITMPNLDGIGALKEIIRVSPNTRIIIVSATGEQTTVIESIKCGATDFIAKPFDKSSVLQTIQKVLCAS